MGLLYLTLPTPGKLNSSWVILLPAGRVSHRKTASLKRRKRSGKPFMRNLNVRTLMLLKGEKGKNSSKQRLALCGKWDYWKPWVTSKTPIPPLMAQFTELCKGCPYCNIVPVNQYVLYIELFLCLYMHCPIIIIIMYMCWPNILSKRKISAILLTLFYM